MSEYFVLNEASIPFFSVTDCKNNLDVSFKILHEASLNGVNFFRADGLEGEWNSFIYADGFDLGRWINEIEDKDQSRIVKSVISKVKCPLVSIENNTENLINNSLFVLLADKDIEVKGLGVASVMSVHGFSFASHAYWTVDPVTIVRQWDQGGIVQENIVDVPNVYSLAQLHIVLDKIRAEKETNRNYFYNIVAVGSVEYPQLVFCESAINDLRSSSVTSRDFPKIIDVLKKLDRAIFESNNIEELVRNSELNITRESIETMQNPKLSRKKLFKHPSLGKVSFTEHVKNFPDGKRMYIFADYAENSICIGYFGRHLPTVQNPT